MHKMLFHELSVYTNLVEIQMSAKRGKAAIRFCEKSFYELLLIAHSRPKRNLHCALISHRTAALRTHPITLLHRQKRSIGAVVADLLVWVAEGV